MSDGTPTGRRRLTKTHKRLLGGAGSIAVIVARLRLRPPAVRELPRRARRRAWPELAGLAPARRRRRPEPCDLPATVDGRPAGSRLPRGAGHDPGLDGAVDRLARGCRRRHGRVVLDAPVVEVRRRGRRPRGRDRGHLESAGQPCVPGRRARAPDEAGRGSSGATNGCARRRRRACRRGHCVRARPVACRVGSAYRRRCRTPDEPRAADCAQGPGGVGRSIVHAFPVPGRSDCCAAAGT